MLRLESVFRCSLGRHWGCEDEIGWRTADDALKGSGVLVPEGSGGCAIHAGVHKRQDFAVNTHFNK